jgi:hypothetical protein
MRLVSLLLLLVASMLRPTRANCPPRWWLHEGVRATGEFQCAPLPPEPIGDRDLGFHDVELRSRIYCTGGHRAITVDGVAVGCQPGGWQ